MAGSLGLQATRGETQVLAAESPRKFKGVWTAPNSITSVP